MRQTIWVSIKIVPVQEHKTQKRPNQTLYPRQVIFLHFVYIDYDTVTSQK